MLKLLPLRRSYHICRIVMLAVCSFLVMSAILLKLIELYNCVAAAAAILGIKSDFIINEMKKRNSKATQGYSLKLKGKTVS